MGPKAFLATIKKGMGMWPLGLYRALHSWIMAFSVVVFMMGILEFIVDTGSFPEGHNPGMLFTLILCAPGVTIGSAIGNVCNESFKNKEEKHLAAAILSPLALLLMVLYARAFNGCFLLPLLERFFT